MVKLIVWDQGKISGFKPHCNLYRKRSMEERDETKFISEGDRGK